MYDYNQVYNMYLVNDITTNKMSLHGIATSGAVWIKNKTT